MPRIVPTLVMSASCASVIPTLTILSTQACGGSDKTCNYCGDVADISFGDHHYGGDVAAAFDVWSGDVSDEGDALTVDDASDAADGRE